MINVEKRGFYFGDYNMNNYVLRLICVWTTTTSFFQTWYKRWI